MIPAVRYGPFPKVSLDQLLLIVANVLAFLYELQMDPSTLKGFIFTWGLIPSHLLSDPASAWITIFTAMFLHGGWFHIISNMWVLVHFGDNVEARMGGFRYFIFYLLSGTAAGLLQAYILPSSGVR